MFTTYDRVTSHFMQPEPCIDCLTICCCLPCAVAQHTLEVEEGLPGPDLKGTTTVAEAKDVEPVPHS